MVAGSYTERRDGVSVYIENLLVALILETQRAAGTLHIDVFVLESVAATLRRVVRSHLEVFDASATNMVTQVVPVVGEGAWARYVKVATSLRRRGPYDLVVAPNFQPCWLPAPSLSVLHDLTYRVVPQGFGLWRRLYMDMLTRFRLWQDSAVGVISETTRSDLRSYYPRQAARSTLLNMPNGLPGKLAAMPQVRAEDVAAKLQATPLELLFVGRVNRLKGFDRVRLICQSLDRRLGEAKVRRRAILRVVGKTTNESRELLTGMNFEWITVVSYNYVSDDELNRLYRNAAFCFFLSRNEGFGLPVIESLWSGCVPLLSDAEVFREIMGPDYPLFGENTADSVASHMMEIATSPDRWRHVVDHHQRVLAQWSSGYRRAARAVLSLLPADPALR